MIGMSLLPQSRDCLAGSAQLFTAGLPSRGTQQGGRSDQFLAQGEMLILKEMTIWGEATFLSLRASFLPLGHSKCLKQMYNACSTNRPCQALLEKQSQAKLVLHQVASSCSSVSYCLSFIYHFPHFDL